MTINGKPSTEDIFFDPKQPAPLTFEFDISSTKDNFPSNNYTFVFPNSQIECSLFGLGNFCGATITGNKALISLDDPRAYTSGLNKPGVHSVELVHESGVKACQSIQYEVVDKIKVEPCRFTFQNSNNKCDITDEVKVIIEGKSLGKARLTGPETKEYFPPGDNRTRYEWVIGKLVVGNYTISVQSFSEDNILCQASFPIKLRFGSQTSSMQYLQTYPHKKT